MYTKTICTSRTIEIISRQFFEHYTFPVEGQPRIVNVGDVGYTADCSHIDWDLAELQDLINVPLDTPRLFIVKPNNVLPAHKDCVGKTKQVREWAINIPVFGCNRGYNVWYNDQQHFTCEYVYPSTFVLTSPTPPASHKEKLDSVKLFRTDLFHAVDNTDNINYRVVLSVRSSQDRSWGEMYESI